VKRVSVVETAAVLTGREKRLGVYCNPVEGEIPIWVVQVGHGEVVLRRDSGAAGEK
jgi:hypothetical protein